MNILSNTVDKEHYRTTTIRKFPDSIKERLWKIKEETGKRFTLEAIIIEALKIGLPKIEHRVFFRIPNFVEEPRDEEPGV